MEEIANFLSQKRNKKKRNKQKNKTINTNEFALWANNDLNTILISFWQWSEPISIQPHRRQVLSWSVLWDKIKECFTKYHWWIQGGHQGCAPPRLPNYCIFIQFSASSLQNNTLAHQIRELAPPPGKSWISHCKLLQNLSKSSNTRPTAAGSVVQFIFTDVTSHTPVTQNAGSDVTGSHFCCLNWWCF